MAVITRPSPALLTTAAAAAAMARRRPNAVAQAPEREENAAAAARRNPNERVYPTGWNRATLALAADETMRRFSVLLAHEVWGPRIRQSVRETVFYQRVGPTTPLPTAERGVATRIRVVEGDTLTVARELRARQGFRHVCALNMASERHPGGGWLRGASAQEESLARRSTAYLNLADPSPPEDAPWASPIDPTRTWTYPIPRFGGVWTPDVLVFRSPEADGLRFYDEAEYYSLDMIAVPGLRRPRLEHGAYSNADRTVAIEKMRAMLRIPIHQQRNDVLVLGAWGCGAFGNPPRVVAQLFDAVIREPEFRGRYSEICFAVFDPDRRGNHAVFAEVITAQ